MSIDDNAGKPPCCEGSGCCAPESGKVPSQNAPWKTIVFTAVIVLAAGVAAYSLFWRSPDATSTACCPPGSEAAAACGSSTVIPVFDHSMAPAGLSLYLLLSATNC